MRGKINNKFAYYVRLYCGRGKGTVRYITAHNGSLLEWKENEKPLAMSKAEAEEVCFRLCINFECAEIVYEQACNVEAQSDYINGWLNEIIAFAQEQIKKQESEENKGE